MINLGYYSTPQFILFEDQEIRADTLVFLNDKGIFFFTQNSAFFRVDWVTERSELDTDWFLNPVIACVSLGGYMYKGSDFSIVFLLLPFSPWGILPFSFLAWNACVQSFGSGSILDFVIEGYWFCICGNFCVLME